ncbi:MAG: phage tail assembly protein [Roseiarcus sp.]|jgi:hypothetical protein
MADADTTADDIRTITLSRPLRTHKGDLSELTLKEPTAGTFFRAKRDPYTVKFEDEKAIYTFDPVACMFFLSEMTGLDQITLEALSAGDFSAMRWRMVGIINRGVGGKNPSTASAE